MTYNMYSQTFTTTLRRRRRRMYSPLPNVVVRFYAAAIVLRLQLLLLLQVLLIVIVTAQDENPCQMEIHAYTDLETCTSNTNTATARAVLVADGQCRSVLDFSASVSPTTNEDAYNLLPGNYRAECINSTAVRFIESGCIADQCNSTSLLTGEKCDRNDKIAASLYSLLKVPEYIVFPSRDEPYTCIIAFGGDNVTVAFVIFGECSSPTCVIPTPAPIFPITPAPMTTIITTNAPTTLAPVVATTPTSPTLIITPPSTPSVPSSMAPTNFPVLIDNPTFPPNRAPSSTTSTTRPSTPQPSLLPVPPPVSAPVSAPSSPTTTTGMVPPSTDGTGNNNNSNVTNPSTTDRSSASSSTLIAGVASGVAFAAVLLAAFLLYRNRQSQRHKDTDDHRHKNIVVDDGFGMSHNSGSDHRTSNMNTGGGLIMGNNNNSNNNNPYGSNVKDDSTAQLYAATTNEIWVDPNADDVSTLGGGTLPNEFVFGSDEPTASVNMDYDYNRNQYRIPDAEERTQSQFTTASNPTTFTNFSKLGLLGQADFAADDDHSFEEQFAELDNDIRSTPKYDTVSHPRQSANSSNNNNGNMVSNRVKPFEVRAPPGKLGMVVDTPNGGVPVVRAIKADSVLNGSVQVGDRLISVDHVNVTSMSALEVSNLISLKQHQQRLLIFCRLTPT